MKSITGLRELDSNRVLVELDGAPWRPIPVAVAARAGLSVGKWLDRPLARALAVELRRERALDVAMRALGRRSLPKAAVDERLARRGIRSAERSEVLARLEGAGYLDDERYALARASQLAERGYGNAVIAHALRGEGVAAELTSMSLARLQAESVRVAALLDGTSDRPKALRRLAGRGFDPELLADLAGALGDQ